MINWIKRKLGIHIHSYGEWEFIKISSDDFGGVIVYQARVCKDCGYIQVSKQEL